MPLRSSFYLLAGLFLAALLVAACNSNEMKRPSAQTQPTPVKQQQPVDDGVRRVSVQELQDLLTRGQAVVIDVRNQASYDSGHIQGAKLIPYNEIQTRSSELPQDKLIVTYCS
jgi:predicted sulfurtransferase